MPRTDPGLTGILTPSLLIFVALWVGGAPAATAGSGSNAVAEGYVTSLLTPDGFVVNGVDRVITTASTTYQLFGSKEVENKSAASTDVQVGVLVQAKGTEQAGILRADLVRVRDLGDKTIRGYGLIDKVIVAGTEPVFRADGYRIRTASGAAVKFSGRLKSLADVGTSDWVQYEGRLDNDGDLVATKAEFSPGKTGLKKPDKLAKDAAIPDTIPPNATIIDADGNFKGAHEKVRMENAGGACGWHRLAKDEALQQRVQRVGLSVVPAYQNELAPGEKAKIHFRFYAIDDPGIHSDLVCNSGLILMPQQAADRLRGDDQLAAVLAEGVADDLQWQSARLAKERLEIVGSTAFAAGVTGGGIANETFQRVADVLLEQQRGRMALALMDDAGYDPWQAPEAWRLLAPKNLPKDLGSLKYPNRSGYQLAILHLQYPRVTKDAPSAAVTHGRSQN